MGPVTIFDMIPKARAPAWKGNIFRSELIAAKSSLSVYVLQQMTEDHEADNKLQPSYEIKY
jgi:hypothetical protein